MWLHEHEVVRLNRGLTVFRTAMTISLEPGTRGFRRTDFRELEEHYGRTVRQIHVMAEFAEQGRIKIADALRLSLDYFELGDDEFVRRWLPGRGGEIERQTTAVSWKAIVGDLSSAQRAIAADDREATNVLVLAGPGSGKTRVLVHRIAYLIRVRRQNPRGILALAYNRHAAADGRRRLRGLIGDDEYRLISALAGRTATDGDTRLTLFAMGDDDQNIFSFNGTSPEFIRRFQQDYDTAASQRCHQETHWKCVVTTTDGKSLIATA